MSKNDFSVKLAKAVENAGARRERNLRVFLADLIDVDVEDLPENIYCEEFAEWFNARTAEVFVEFVHGKLFIDGAIK